MKLSKCVYGTLVQNLKEPIQIGMVVGITNNVPHADLEERSRPDRAIPVIQWSNGNTSGCHHENLMELR